MSLYNLPWLLGNQQPTTNNSQEPTPAAPLRPSPWPGSEKTNKGLLFLLIVMSRVITYTGLPTT
ncbi:hypothetical protein K504DRAFT_466941 [Pleomassaria siparia CBS 279.74]|uniref:Uncharacterized protein n=1 Tax=Pleomassaria siparia CBS 279.74 TaxID=1314801 RepID=A0A6G1KDL6_9PLEO|nr:hypothetical protein K504DRAFT_466941 [Pleomassaria siparia CBS 279.74]